jgi:hypothetical protein
MDIRLLAAVTLVAKKAILSAANGHPTISMK